MKSIALLAWRNLSRNIRRTLASVMTVALGAAGLLIFQGFNTGLMNQYRDATIRGHYGFGQVFPEGYYGTVKEKPWEHWLQNVPQTEATLRTIPEIKQIFPRLTFYAFLVKGGINLGGRGEGIVPEREVTFFDKMNFIDGHNVRDENDIVIGKGLANSLGVKAGDTVTVLTQTIHGQLNGADMNVAGVFHMGVKAIDDQFFRLPLKTAQSLLDTDRIELFSLQTTGVDAWKTVEKSIQEKLPFLDPISFDVLDKIYYQHSVDFLEAQFGFVRSIILVIVALGIFNTIAVGLLERAGEIGALRANGEGRRRLFAVLITESALLGILGGLSGGALAILLNHTVLAAGIPIPPGPGITRDYIVFLEMLPKHFLIAIALTTVAAIIASIFPIRKLLSRTIPDLLRS